MGVAKVIAVGFLALLSAAPQGGSLPHAATAAGPKPFRLPQSLDALYPPAVDRPIYLLSMLSLETSFSGIAAELMEGDLDGAKGSFDDFVGQYREQAGMIPEWKRGYPEDKVKELGQALAAGNRKLALSAFEAVGATCHDCHVAVMVPVQQKYHWGEFGALDVWDPLNGKPAGYRQFKKYLTTNLAGITVNLRQGQTSSARKQFEAFRARFEALSGTCGVCHEKESRYFVDREMQNVVEELGKTLRNPTVAVEPVIALVQKIGRETCSRCHLVHLPASYARYSAQ